MNILYCAIDPFGVGGVQRYSRYEMSCLERIVAPDRIGAVSLGPSLENEDTVNQDLPRELMATVSGSRVEFMKAVFTQMRRTSPDLIIVDHINIAPVALCAATWLRIPYIVNVYGLEVWRPLRLPWRLALTRASAIMSDCVFTKNYLLSHYQHLPPVHVVEDPVDCDLYRPAETNKDMRASLGLGSGPVLLTVSRLHSARSKGHDIVMRAMARIRDSHPDLQYLIVGDGDDRPRLEALAQSLDLSPRVIFAGRIPDSDLPAVYHTCDLFVLVSRFQEGAQSSGEGVPLVVLEAQASGRPVITGKLDGSAESIIDGETGLLVDPHDEADVAAAINSLLSNPDLLREMSTRAAEVAENRNSLPVFQEKLSHLLTAVMKTEGYSL